MLNKVLVVGQGLAGTAMARYLEINGVEVQLIASAKKASASRVAAGVWNPVVVKRFVPAWQAEEALQLSAEFYRSEEKRLGATFFHTLPLHKLLSNQAEIEQMEQQWEKRNLGLYCDHDLLKQLPEGVKDFPAALRIRESGYLDVPTFLDAIAQDWKMKGCYSEADFDYAALKNEKEQWIYAETAFDAVVFCEGIGALENPFLVDFPLVKMKGEILKVKLPALRSELALNKSIFILPLGSQEYKVGATYQRDATDAAPTKEAKDELIEKLGEIAETGGFEVLDHAAGFRPAVKDRRPLLGEVPDHKGLYVLNGLGSRGVMLAPLMATWLGQCMLHSVPLSQEVQVHRFLK